MTHYKFDENGNKYIETKLRGKEVTGKPLLNKGCVFTYEERRALGLLGRLPHLVEPEEVQIARHYNQFKQMRSDLQKNIFLHQLRDKNEILFYKLITEHITEMLPIIYTPTVGEAVQQFSHEVRKVRGLYFSYPDKDHIDEIFENRYNRDVDLIVVTDGEGVLGIGDQGVGGMDISIAKLIVYSMCGGIDPARVLPIQLDVGTNNKTLLRDPMYLGWRSGRIDEAEYDAFIDAFVASARRNLGDNVFIHWEDFGLHNARRILDRYNDTICTFNDDMQGTGATALACVMSGSLAANRTIKDEKVIVFGAGTAGCGIADQICLAMIESGLTEEQAQGQIYLVDRPGLLYQDTPDLAWFQKPYAKPRGDLSATTLEEVVKAVHPTCLIGCSTVHGAFNQAVVEAMAAHVERPIILPLSNPTSKSEATPLDLLNWTGGRALIATGSPFDPVDYNGKTYRISQSNNAFIFPGIGLGVVAAQASRLTPKMIATASRTLAEQSPSRKDPQLPLLPDLDHISSVTRSIAQAVAECARQEGVSTLDPNKNLKERIDEIYWKPEYLPIKAI